MKQAEKIEVAEMELRPFNHQDHDTATGPRTRAQNEINTHSSLSSFC